MLYNVTADIQKKDTGKKYMLPGIHPDTLLTKIEYKKMDSGSEFIAFYFENRFKEQLCHTEWKVMPKRNIETMSDKDKALYLRLVNEQIARINAIATTYISEEDFRKVSGNTFEEFCNNAIKAFGESYKNKKVRIKAVYDKRNFTALPSYTNYVWIEPMSIPEEESAIKILKKDKLEKSVPKTLEGANERTNELEEISINTGDAPVLNNDDLPF